MATTTSTQIVLQQLVNVDNADITASKYPKYTINLGYLIGNITAGELSDAINRSQASAAAARVSETNAKTSETNAKTSETNSKTSETNADVSEAAAKASEVAAKTSETNAKTSETNAKASEIAAKTSETNSKASETAANASAAAAKTSETNAKTSETNAKASETAAALSETNAKASEEASALSETNAKASEEASAISEANSKASEEAAAISETNSKTSETNSKASEEAAAISETNSKTSETNSKASEEAAAISETSAEVSAVKAETQADRAQGIADTMPSREQFLATVKLYDTHQEAIDDLVYRVEGEKVLIWDETPAAYGWFDVVEENGVKSLELDRNELKIKSINNVRPDDAGNVQITLPGGNPSLWLGETVLFQYDPDQGIGYSGLLPQDGRMVLRVDYPDMWNAIAQGFVPSVTEDAWQAGAQNSFSTGDGSTNFRLPKWNGEAIRTPVLGEEGDEFFEQIPYVVTVNGLEPDEETGNVQLEGLAESGINSDITNLEALSGSLRLGGDAAGDYDAVTLRQLLAASGGAGGPSLTGVMNNHIGAVSWFVGSRAKLPAGHVAADGQILNRADYPEIWNAISTGMLQSVTDAVWVASTASRASFSTGDGSTTFRMPDLNGMQQNSIKGVFLRGDGSEFSVGTIAESATPNITGTLTAQGATSWGAASGAFSSSGTTAKPPAQNSADARDLPNLLTFDASKSSPVYGRDSTTEVRPNSATGIWIIRVNGQFSASDTNFNVFNGDTSLPVNGTTVYGGDIRSVYQVEGANYGVARLRSKITIGGLKAIELGFQDSSTGTVDTSALEIRAGASGSGGAGMDIVSTSGELGLYSSSSGQLRLRADGSVRLQTSLGSTFAEMNAGGISFGGNLVAQSSQLYVQRGYFNQSKDIVNGEVAIFNSNSDATVGVRFGIANLASGNARRFYAGDINGNNQLVQTLPNSTGTITVTTSDKNLKNYTGDVIPADAYDRISRLQPVEYTWNEKYAVDPDILNKPRRGLFAQDAYAVDERYAVKPTDEQLEIDIVWGLEDRAIMADMIATIQILQKKIAALENK